MKEIVHYKTIDGLIFKDYNEAIQHEKKLDHSKDFLMFNDKGNEVDSSDNATIIWIADNYDEDNETNISAEKFYQYNSSRSLSISGIENDSYGLFIWDDWSDQYHWIDDDIVKALEIVIPKLPH